MENPTQPTSEATTATHNNRPKGDAPNLASATTDALIFELYRRQRAGECVGLIFTPDDLAEWWECDDSGATSPASRVPDADGMKAISKAFERWQDSGGFGEIMNVCRDAWLAELDRKGKGDAR